MRLGHLPELGRWALALLSGLLLVSPCLAGVEISEFMAVNNTSLATVGGRYEDWIEIHNHSGAAVDLAGWYLTDDPADLRKWQFPSTAATSPLADSGYLLVFADGSDDAVIGTELHASFKLSSGGEFLALVEPDGWEVDHFGSTEDGFPGVDSDGDGILNVNEAVAGTTPTDATSFFRIEQVNSAGLSWTAVSHRKYSVERTGDLREPFVEIASGLVVGSYPVNLPPGGATYFYRIRVKLE